MNSFSSIDISASGLAAERLRMEVAANNIANANTTSTPEGTPYQRRVVAFATAMADHEMSGSGNLAGVRVVGVHEDPAPFPLVYNPGHPHVDENDMVKMPNVQLPNEMIDMIGSSRTYEANLRAITIFKEMVEQSLQLLNGGR